MAGDPQATPPCFPDSLFTTPMTFQCSHSKGLCIMRALLLLFFFATAASHVLVFQNRLSTRTPVNNEEIII